MRIFALIILSILTLPYNYAHSQYSVLNEDDQQEILAARQKAIEEAKAARAYEGYVEPTTQRQVYSEDYNPELDAQIWAEQERLLAEEEARLAEEAAKQKALEEEKARAEKQAAAEEEARKAAEAIKTEPLYDAGTEVRKTIAQKRAERRAAKEGRVFR